MARPTIVLMDAIITIWGMILLTAVTLVFLALIVYLGVRNDVIEAEVKAFYPRFVSPPAVAKGISRGVGLPRPFRRPDVP
jgi:hypothetical protein